MSRTPEQSWQTDGLPAMERPGLATRFFLTIVRCVERLNLTHAKLGNPCVHSNSAFPWAGSLEREWRVIRAELDGVLVRKEHLPNVQEITPDAASISRDAGWKIFPLLAYGIRSQPNIELCPQTWRLVRLIPGLKTAMFSILEPGKRIPPHRGPYNGVLRLHLGLRIPGPPERTGIRVGDEQRRWEEGCVLIFDDAYEHEAWNDTSDVRVVLFVDFAKPLRFPANLLNRALLEMALFSPFLREGGANLRRWERRFHGDASARQRNPAS
ncbi:MAG TPA: aspartyl/asparaginyl beta-hydroxylase domain-containing protein [Burkholderiales bacterium]|nr:aspartyl/asparaginyl beta-hydroxylase domain-containing protein [Burkholderiales bacterium]